ncbi:MAG: mechanosensitive ion channel family protein [Saprospiraceae bacterium]|nr:mechanosensitive ion channel family protein [Saprospiraceae bacterium]
MMKELNSSWEKLFNKLESILDSTVMLLPNLILAIVVAVVGYFAVRYVQEKLHRLMKKHLSNPTIAEVMSRVIAFALMVGLLFVILGILNLDQLLTSLLATAGVLGLAVGLALQEPLANAFGGVMLSLRSRYNIGDLVETNDFFGSIKEVNLRTTVMSTPAGQEVSIPNKLVLQNPIINYSISGKRRVEVDCGISYGENLDQVEQIVLDAMKSVDKLEDQEVEFFYTSFGDSSINFRVRFWIRQDGQKAYYMSASEAMRVIKRAFDEQDILIPFPIRTLDFGIKGGKHLADELQVVRPTEESNGLAQG